MPSIEVVDSGHVDRSDSAFPSAVRLDNGDLVCGYSMGGGAHVSGGTHCSRSRDDGRTWSYQGAILEPTTEPLFTNHLPQPYRRRYHTRLRPTRSQAGERWEVGASRM